MMIIHSLELKNIRSYIDEKIDFPETSILLRGDVGSGKTTILLAVEFALFGILKGEISGGMLLRHGENEGSVRLVFSIDNSRIEVFRCLKRTSSGIKQSSGYMIINGIREEFTHTELKSNVLELLGYPEALLTKTKGLIFRFTVYTPQEMMKQILFESSDDRVNTLRTIFNIDRYKNVKDNAQVLARELRSFQGVIKARVERLPEVEGDVKEHKVCILSLKGELTEISEKISAQKSKVLSQQKAVEECDRKRLEHLELKKKLELAKSELRNRESNISAFKKELEELAARVSRAEKELAQNPEDADALKQEISALEKEFDSILDSSRLIERKIAGLEERKSSNDDRVSEIKKLDKCPTCLQKVEAGHIKDIEEKHAALSATIDNEVKKLAAGKRELLENEKTIRARIASLREREKAAASAALKLKGFREDEKRLQGISEKIRVFSKERDDISEKIKIIEAKEEAYRSLEEKMQSEKQVFEKMQSELRISEIQRAEKNREYELKLESLARLEKELGYMGLQKERLRKVQEGEHWVSSFFIPVADRIEKQVMAKILAEFNEFFSEWFDLIMDDETISARLDESFTPIISQNGYETNLENLSGGEKTSLALAYRLALNRVINDLVSNIKTKDILILDEPTDGFSAEQLDKVRDVLERLNVKQLIMVSHEQKLESYANHVIRISKSEHVSRQQ